MVTYCDHYYYNVKCSSFWYVECPGFVLVKRFAPKTVTYCSMQTVHCWHVNVEIFIHFFDVSKCRTVHFVVSL